MLISSFRRCWRLELTPLAAEWQTSVDQITAAIFFTNSWKGALIIDCRRSLAFDITAKLMSIGRPDAINDDVRDSMGELANMIGGNLKSILPAGVGLSMPSVVEGSNYSIRICGPNTVHHEVFTCGSEKIYVRLVEVVEKQN